MVKTLIILILLFDGTLIQERVKLPVPSTPYDCLDYGALYASRIATFKENGQYLNDGRGTIQVFICE